MVKRVLFAIDQTTGIETEAVYHLRDVADTYKLAASGGCCLVLTTDGTGSVVCLDAEPEIEDAHHRHPGGLGHVPRLRYPGMLTPTTRPYPVRPWVGSRRTSAPSRGGYAPLPTMRASRVPVRCGADPWPSTPPSPSAKALGLLA